MGIRKQDAVYKDKLNSVQILSMLRPTLERLAGEIKRSLTYYESQLQGQAVSKILIAGLAARIPNLDKFLNQELTLDIQKISLVDKNIASTHVNLEALASNYASFGLAVDYTENINLLPYEFRTEKVERFQKVSLRWVTFVSLVLLVFSYIFARVGVSAYKRRLDYALLYLNTLSEVKQIKTGIDEFNKFITDIRNLEPPIGLILKKLSNIVSKELFIDDLSLNCDSKVVKISGFIRSSKKNPDIILTKFIHDMEALGYFSNTTITSVEKITREDVDIAKFNLSFKLR